jgi:hypothetical protein
VEEVAVAVEIVETAVETEATVQTVEIVPNAATAVTAATLVAEDVAIVDVDVLTSEAATVVVAVEDEAAMLLMSPTRALFQVSAHDALQSHREHFYCVEEKSVTVRLHTKPSRRLHHRREDWNESSLFSFPYKKITA